MKKMNGSGSIHKLPGKRRKPWAVRVTCGWDEEGNQIRKYVGYYKSKREAEEALTKYNPITAIEFSDFSLGSIYERWSNRFERLSKKTVSMYKVAWNHLQVLAPMDIREIRTYHLQGIIDGIAELSRSSQKHIKSLAVQLFDYCIKNDILKTNFAEFIELKEQDEKETKGFSEAEIQYLWDHVEIPYVDSILFLIYTGMRIGELTTLTFNKINLEEAYIQHGNKTKAGKRKIVPIHPRILPLIQKRIRENKSIYLLERNGEEINVDYYRKEIYYPLLEQLNLPKYTPHQCRHTLATRLGRCVSDKQLISKIMGHTDYAITANVYTHKDIQDLKSAMNLLP